MDTTRPRYGLIATAALVGFGLLVMFIVALSFGCQAYNRYQARNNANNKVKINNIRIRYYEQEKQIEKQKADIRVIQAEGLRKAQDRIARTLTPLYVQFELTQAMQAIATSGQNNSIIYIPTNPSSGLPVVPTSNTSSH